MNELRARAQRSPTRNGHLRAAHARLSSLCLADSNAVNVPYSEPSAGPSPEQCIPRPLWPCRGDTDRAVARCSARFGDPPATGMFGQTATPRAIAAPSGGVHGSVQRSQRLRLRDRANMAVPAPRISALRAVSPKLVEAHAKRSNQANRLSIRANREGVSRALRPRTLARLSHRAIIHD